MKRSFFQQYGEWIIIGLCLGGFLFGSILTSLTRDHWLAIIPWLDPDTFWKIEELDVNKRALFFLVIEKRLGAFFLFWLLSKSIFGRLVNVVFFFLQGFFVGLVMELMIIKYGIRGMFFYFGMIFPQGLCYLLGYFILGLLFWKRSKKVEVIRLHSGSVVLGKERSRGKLAFGLTMIIMGILLEVTVHPELIKKVSEALLQM